MQSPLSLTLHCIHIYHGIHVYVHVYIYIYIHVHIYMYVCVYSFVYVHICIHNLLYTIYWLLFNSFLISLPYLSLYYLLFMRQSFYRLQLTVYSLSLLVSAASQNEKCTSARPEEIVAGRSREFTSACLEQFLPPAKTESLVVLVSKEFPGQSKSKVY